MKHPQWSQNCVKVCRKTIFLFFSYWNIIWNEKESSDMKFGIWYSIWNSFFNFYMVCKCWIYVWFIFWKLKSLLSQLNHKEQPKITRKCHCLCIVNIKSNNDQIGLYYWKNNSFWIVNAWKGLSEKVCFSFLDLV